MVRGHQSLDGVGILTLEGSIEVGCRLVDCGDGLGVAGSGR
jgi:hypothetical protein